MGGKGGETYGIRIMRERKKGFRRGMKGRKRENIKEGRKRGEVIGAKIILRKGRKKERKQTGTRPMR